MTYKIIELHMCGCPLASEVGKQAYLAHTTLNESHRDTGAHPKLAPRHCLKPQQGQSQSAKIAKHCCKTHEALITAAALPSINDPVSETWM